MRITTYLGLYDLSMCCFQLDPSTRATAEKSLMKISAQNIFILQSAKWHEATLFTTSRLGCPSTPIVNYQRALKSTSGNSVLDQAERESKRSACRSSGCQTCYSIVIGVCTIASIEIVALKNYSYRHMHVILSTVLQIYTRDTR